MQEPREGDRGRFKPSIACTCILIRLSRGSLQHQPRWSRLLLLSPPTHLWRAQYRRQCLRRVKRRALSTMQRPGWREMKLARMRVSANQVESRARLWTSLLQHHRALQKTTRHSERARIVGEGEDSTDIRYRNPCQQSPPSLHTSSRRASRRRCCCGGQESTRARSRKARTH